MELLTVKELEDLAKARGLSGYSKMNKTQLLDLLGFTRSPEKEEKADPLDPYIPEKLTSLAPLSVSSGKPKMQLRMLDKSTAVMSDNPDLPIYDPVNPRETLPPGMKRLDASTVIAAAGK